MEYINKIEAKMGGWLKNVPHLPIAGQKWLGQNIWWIALVGAIGCGFAALFGLIAVYGLASEIGQVSSTYYVVQGVTTWGIIVSTVSLVFTVIQGLLFGLAVKPLQDLQKKGWVLLFAVLLVEAVAVAVNAFLTLNIAGFVVGILFGSIWLAIGAYFVYEIRGQFVQVSKPATAAATKKTTKPAKKATKAKKASK